MAEDWAQNSRVVLSLATTRLSADRAEKLAPGDRIELPNDGGEVRVNGATVAHGGAVVIENNWAMQVESIEPGREAAETLEACEQA